MRQAAQWQVKLSLPAKPQSLADVFLRFRYTGDIAQLRSGSFIMDDNFFNGETWTVGMRKVSELPAQSTFTLSILPLNLESAILLEPNVRQNLADKGQVVKLTSLVAVPQYRLQIETSTSNAPRQSERH